jgi:hypothetical protein
MRPVSLFFIVAGMPAAGDRGAQLAFDGGLSIIAA